MKKGFTLIELLVVVLIIGILSSVALPQYTKAVEKARSAEAMTVGRAAIEAQNRYFLANGTYSGDLEALDIEIPDLKYFTLVYSSEGYTGSMRSVYYYAVREGKYMLYFYGTDGQVAGIVCQSQKENMCKSIFACKNYRYEVGTNGPQESCVIL